MYQNFLEDSVIILGYDKSSRNIITDDKTINLEIWNGPGYEISRVAVMKN